LGLPPGTIELITTAPIATAKLTVHEWSGVTSRFNLADGHPRHELIQSQIDALGDVTNLFIRSASRSEYDAKEAFESAFFELAGQDSVRTLDLPLSQYSGSSAIELMANFLRLHGKSVTMMHPTFDSLADTLKRHRVPLTPMPVEELLELTPGSPRIKTVALYFVVPNNPTGHCPTKEQFANIVGYCAHHRILMLVDFCFRFYGDLWDYDQYQMMQEAGVEFITTEDTGKTFPAGDVKLGMTIATESLYGHLKDISDDFLFSVAPFVFAVLTRFVSAERRETRRVLSQDVADANRIALREALAGSKLKIVNNDHRMGLDWVRLPADWNATALTNWLHREGGPQLLPASGSTGLITAKEAATCGSLCYVSQSTFSTPLQSWDDLRTNIGRSRSRRGVSTAATMLAHDPDVNLSRDSCAARIPALLSEFGS
jgi:aspartate/methionine/tyrosine aminotransferase